MTRETGPHRPCVVLVGPPGAGKSTIGRKLARELGAELVDTDAMIEAEAGRTIAEIFTAEGEPEFRRIEEDIVRRAVQADDGIISLGGGAILSAATRELLRERTVVYLEISVAEGLRRTGAATHRPLLAGGDPSVKYRELMRIRRPLYREVASVRVRTDGRSPGRVVRNILARLGLEPVAPVVTPPHPAGTSGAPARRSRRRRRGGRSRGTNKAAAQAVSTTTAQPATAPARTTDITEPNASPSDAAATDGVTSTRRSRRSRRGGRRRSKSQRPATTPDSPTTAAEAQSGSTAAQPVPDQASNPRRRSASRSNSGAAQQSRSGSSRSRTRATAPRPPTEATPAPAHQDTVSPRTTGARRSRAAKRPAGPPTPRPAPDPAAADAARRVPSGDSPERTPAASPNSTGTQRDSDDATPSGRSRWDRARRARTLRAQQESEQTA